MSTFLIIACTVAVCVAVVVLIFAAIVKYWDSFGY